MLLWILIEKILNDQNLTDEEIKELEAYVEYEKEQEKNKKLENRIIPIPNIYSDIVEEEASKVRFRR